MYSLKLVAYIGLLLGVTIAQDYDEYQQAPRSAPARHRSGNGIVDQQRPAPTPVPILKQINRHNEDGSYTYGYEGADGSFKIETKLATGEVKGKYGYVDETGKVRVVEYGANKYGFQPSGEGITVAPPTLVDETTNKDGSLLDYEDEPQPQRQVIARVNRPQPQPRPAPVRPITRPAPPPRPQYNDYDEPISRPQYTSQPGPAPPRIQIPGAGPSDVVYSERPRPARPDAGYTQTQTFAVQPQQSVRVSQPVYQSAPSARAQSFNTPNLLKFAEPQQVPQPVAYSPPSPPKGRSTSVLDQLAKDYALPQGGSQALHDISFGYY